MSETPRARISRLIPLLTMTLLLGLLAGCVEVRVASDFETDGSAVHSIRATVDRAAADDQLVGSRLDLGAIEQTAEAAGLDVERIDESERVGVRVSANAENNDDLSEVLSELFTPLGGAPSQLDAFSGGFTATGNGEDDGTYRFELTIDADALNPMNNPEFNEGTDAEFDVSTLDEFLDMTYTVNMPGEITEHNGDETGPGQVQWEIPTEGTETFTATSEGSSGTPLALILGVGAGVLALALLVVGGRSLMRSQSTPTTSTTRVQE